MKLVLKYILLLLAIATGCNTKAGEYKITKECERALAEILSFRTVSAQKIIDAERAKNPKNMYLYFLENWVDMVKYVGYEDEDHYDAFLDNFDDRLDVMEEEHPTSRFYYAIRAEMYAQAAAMNVMNDDTYTGFLKVYRANKLMNKSKTKFPGFWYNQKLDGMFNVVYGDIPSVVAWAASIVGMEGDTQKGFKILKSYMHSVKGRPGLYPESLLYLIIAHKVTKYDQGAYEILKAHYSKELSTLLDSYFYANILYRTGNNDASIKMLNTLMGRYNPEIPFYNVDYMLGRTKMAALAGDANIYMERYLRNSKSVNYKLEMYDKLADYYLIKGNKDKFNYYRELVLDKGKAFTDRDREALVNAKLDYLPNVKLLKVMYLIRGRYFERARSILQTLQVNTLQQKAQKSEYYLLLGKIQFDDGMYTEALKNFEKAIQIGADEDEQYATDAYYQAGLLALKLPESTKARTYFEKCLDSNNQNTVYVEIIHKMAKNELEKLQK